MPRHLSRIERSVWAYELLVIPGRPVTGGVKVWRNYFTRFLVLFVGIGISVPSAAQETPDLRESIAKEFAGVYRFNYLFVENGIPYVDVADHLQFLELDKFENAPRVTFLNQTGKGEKRGHYNYVFFQKDHKLTLREFDGNGKFRFDCVGTFEPQKEPSSAARRARPNRRAIPTRRSRARSDCSNGPRPGRPMKSRPP